MALPTLKAIPLCNDKLPWEVVRTPDGWRGVQYWKANRSSVTAALGAPELPVLGDVFDGSSPAGLVLRNIRARYHGGGDNAGAGRPGWTILELQYSTPDGNFGGAPERESGVAWREIGGGVQQVTQLFDIDRDEVSPPPEADRPINQGDGIALDVGMIVQTVHVYMPHATFAGLEERLIALKRAQNCNDDDVTLPLLMGIAGTDREVAAGALRFHDFEVRRQRTDDGLVEVIMVFIEASETHLYLENLRDENGNATGVPITRRQYKLDDLSGLW